VFFWGSMVPIAIATYTLARHRDGGPARHAWLAGPVLVACNAVHVAELHTPSNIVFALGLFGAAWLVGRVLRRLSVQSEALAEAVTELERTQEERSRAATLAERRRVAAEMHDVVAHAVSLMTVQVGAARMELQSEGVAVPEQLRAAETSGREALAELRRTLGVLRDHAGEELHPLPGLAGVPALVDRFRQAGLDVELRCDLPEGPMPASLELAAYRVLQEALTNVLRHAGTVAVRVRVGVQDDELVVEVVNEAGESRNAECLGAGNGLRGMRERVALFGGRLLAGPQPDGTFAVDARLPLPGVPLSDRTATHGAVR
jgi:signal transduction histidine kinase